MSQVAHVMTHTYRTFNICVVSYHSSNTHVSLKYHSVRSPSYERPIATYNASFPYSAIQCFLFQNPVSSFDARIANFVEFCYICPINAKCMPIDNCWHILSIYFIQTNSCTLFKTHSHSHLKH
jgi:hypothetical protein